MARDPRLDIPAFREAHKEVCKVYREIDRSEYKRLPTLRQAAQKGDKAAQDLLGRYERAMQQCRETTTAGGR